MRRLLDINTNINKHVHYIVLRFGEYKKIKVKKNQKKINWWIINLC